MGGASLLACRPRRLPGRLVLRPASMMLAMLSILAAVSLLLVACAGKEQGAAEKPGSLGEAVTGRRGDWELTVRSTRKSDTVPRQRPGTGGCERPQARASGFTETLSHSIADDFPQPVARTVA